jgi:hypothetical protein
MRRMINLDLTFEASIFTWTINGQTAEFANGGRESRRDLRMSELEAILFGKIDIVQLASQAVHKYQK